MRVTSSARRLAILALIVVACASRTSLAQNPSPLQEWQYSGGVILARLFQPDLPKWRTILGLASEFQPVYDGSHAYRVSGGPVINVYYRDIWFITTGEGLGYNVFRGDNYQIGLGITYDLGRKQKDDLRNLRGMGDIPAAPVGKFYASWVVSKKFPLIMRIDARQYIGGAQGAVGDAGAYLPLPGSSKTFVMFAGPSITMATGHYMQTVYGISPAQSAASGHPIYEIPHAGTVAAGVGFSATKFITDHWLFNVDAAINQIRGSPAHSPLVETHTQRVVAVSMDYNW